MLENGGNELGWRTIPAVDRFMENIGSDVLIISEEKSGTPRESGVFNEQHVKLL